MALRKILTYPDKFLKEPTKPIENIDQSIQDLIEDMAATMYQAPGVGLAAIQVGIDKSLIVFDVAPRDETRKLDVLINPRIIERQGEFISENEGCLSVPEFRADVKRAELILVEGVDRHGNPVRLEADGFTALVLQHEIDHLNGVLFIDHISKLKREIYKRKVRKWMKNSENQDG